MPRSRLDRELEKLRSDLKTMSELVQNALRDAMFSLKKRDTELAGSVVRLDEEKINVLYREIGERCVQTIALHQPVAGDLRFISTTMNVASNLERIGDYSKDIAMIVPFIVNEKHSDYEKGIIQEMGRISEGMSRDALDSFISRDKKKLDEINSNEERIDEMYGSMFPKAKEMVRKDPEMVSLALNLLLVSKYIERIADHSVNISKRTMYSISGDGKYI